MPNTTHIANSRERGVSTLTMSMILLFTVTMIVVYSANVGIQETKTSANEYRSLQAFAGAQAGIDYVTVQLSKANLTTYANVAETALQYNDNGTTVTVGYYQVSVDTTDPDNLVVTSTGQSADKSATHQIIEELKFAPAMHTYSLDNLKAPLVVSGNINNVKFNNITQSSANLAVWAGGTVNATAVPNTMNVNMDTNLGNATYKLTASNLSAIDVLLDSENSTIIASDPNNTSLFAKTFASSKVKNMKNLGWRYDCSTTCTNPTALTNSNAKARFQVVEGNLTLSNKTIGDSSDPVVIYVDSGNLTLQNTTVNGIVFVKGNWDNGNNSATVNGIVVVDGDLTAPNVSINYDATVLGNIGRVGVYTRVPGSWQEG